MLQLHPNIHHLPDNIWHTMLIAAVAGLLAWGGWWAHLEAIEVLSAGEALQAGQEPALIQGEGHAVYAWIEQLLADSHPLLINRILSAVGWVVSLFLVGRILIRISGFLLALPSLLLLITFPGLTTWMLAGGSGSVGLMFFLLGFASLLQEEHETSWIRGGVFCGCSVLLYPMLILPAIAIVLGTFEWDRVRAIRAGLGFAGAVLAGGLTIGLLSPSGFMGMWSSYSPLPEGAYPIGNLILKSILLVFAAVITVIWGARKRGISWWGLVAALLGGLVSGTSHAYGWIPFFVLLSLSLVKVPGYLEIRHPRSIQSVFLCQLLMWIPVVFS